jgi:hypothetical protein
MCFLFSLRFRHREFLPIGWLLLSGLDTFSLVLVIIPFALLIHPSHTLDSHVECLHLASLQYLTSLHHIRPSGEFV